MCFNTNVGVFTSIQKKKKNWHVYKYLVTIYIPSSLCLSTFMLCLGTFVSAGICSRCIPSRSVFDIIDFHDAWNVSIYKVINISSIFSDYLFMTLRDRKNVELELFCCGCLCLSIVGYIGPGLVSLAVKRLILHLGHDSYQNSSH